MKSLPLRLLLLTLCLGTLSSLHAQPARDGNRSSRDGARASRGNKRSSPRNDHEDSSRDQARPTTDPVYEPPVALFARFDRDGDGRLDTTERTAARDYVAAQPNSTPEVTTPRASNPATEDRALEPVKPGEKIDPATLPKYADRPLYDPATLRTLALAFDDADWEHQLALFAATDIWVPARVTLDGITYPGVGVHFGPLPSGEKREPGYKRSLILRFDYSDPQQRLAGQRELQLLDAFHDPTFLRTSLALTAARDSGLPAPRSNFLTLAINGESWGVYVNQQPFDDTFLRESFGTAAGARWTVLSGGGLTYLGEDPAPYRAIYRLETPESPAAWTALIKLCRTLAQSEPEDLATALEPQLDVNGALRFLAWENALSNQAGYFARGGGYGLYLDPAGRFYLIPLTGESALRLVEKETYERASRGFGARGGGGPRGGGGGAREVVAERPSPRAETATSAANASAASSPSAKPTAAPTKTQTDLAMMLSYSFVYKSDRDDDAKVSREEWADFASGWFTIMDDQHAGQIGRDQFLDKFRWFVTPPSMRDGKSRQTYGADDPAAVIGGQFFAEMQADASGRVSREEFVAAFDRLYTRWLGAAKTLTQPLIDTGLEKMIPATVFIADQAGAAKRDKFLVNDDTASGPGGGRGDGPGGRGGQRGGEGGGGRGAGGGGSGVSVGLPIHGLRVGTDSFRRRSEGSAGGRTLVIERSQLEVLAGMDDPRRALTNKLLQPLILRWRYYGYLHAYATDWLAWERLGPLVKQRFERIGSAVQRDTHKPDSYEHFIQRIDQDLDSSDAEPSLKKIAAERRELILSDEYVKRHPDGK